MSQLPVKFPAAYESDRVWSKILAEVTRVSDSIGRSEVCFDLDLKPSSFDCALREADRHQLKARHLPYFAIRDQYNAIPEIFAELCGCELATPKPLSASEKLARIESELDRLDPEFSRLIRDRAYGGRR